MFISLMHDLRMTTCLATALEASGSMSDMDLRKPEPISVYGRFLAAGNSVRHILPSAPT